MIDHFLPVNRQVDRPAHLHIRGKIIADFYAILPYRLRHCREVKSTVVHRLTVQKTEFWNRLVCIGRRRVRHIHLPGAHRRKCRILFHKENRNLPHLRRIPIIIRVGFQNHLLPLVPLFQDISPGTDRMCAVIRSICMLRHNSRHRHRV